MLRGLMLLVTATTLTFFSGCGGSDLPELGYVEGTVTLDGKPLPNVVLTFQPVKARPAYGRTDENGWYEIIYTDGNPGATLGTHSVRISSADADSGGEEENYEEDGGDYESEDGDREGRGEKIPRKYTQDGELTAEVKAGENVFNFDLKSDAE